VQSECEWAATPLRRPTQSRLATTHDAPRPVGAHEFFQDPAKHELVLKRFQSGQRLRLFLARLGHTKDAIDEHVQAGDGVCEAFDDWLAKDPSLSKFVDILIGLEEAVLASKLGVRAFYDEKMAAK
jgi:hypothetical protein